MYATTDNLSKMNNIKPRTRFERVKFLYLLIY